MAAGIREAGRGQYGGRNTCQVTAAVGIALRSQCGTACSQEGNAAQGRAAIVELVLAPRAVCNGGNQLPGRICNRDTAGGSLIVANFCQPSTGIKIALISVLVRDAVLGSATSGSRHDKIGVDLVLICTGRFVLEVMPCGIFVLPDIVGVVGRPLIDKLVIIAAPAVAHTEIIIGLIVGVIHVIDSHRHTIAGEPQTVVDPDKVSRIVIDIACTCCAGTVGGVIPDVFQTAVVNVGNAQVLRFLMQKRNKEGV